MNLVLASSSPRRHFLLTEAGYDFTTIVPDVTEIHDEAACPRHLTRLNALLKARAVAPHHPHTLVLGADTLVSIDAIALGKPADLAEARRMHARLTGRTHEVTTAVALIHGPREHVFETVTRVTFKPLSPAQIDHYLTLIDPLDKAGAYAIQEHGDTIIAHIEGSHSNVAGLPMEDLKLALADW